jgi:hypothetical protein
MVDVAEIKIWGELAGAVRWDEEKQLAFQCCKTSPLLFGQCTPFFPFQSRSPDRGNQAANQL